MYSSDENIIDSIKADGELGVKMLFDKYYRPLVLYAEEFTGDIGTAEDIVQELFIRLWSHKYLHNVSPTSLTSYLYLSTRNAVNSHVTKKDVLRKSRPLEQSINVSDVIPDTDEEKIDIVMAEIERLPARTREALENVMLKKMKYKEAAEAMGISVNTVKFLLKDGTKRLRKAFADTNLLLIFIIKELRHKTSINRKRGCVKSPILL